MNASIESAPAAAGFREVEPQTDFDRLLQKSFSPREILEEDSLDKMMRLAEQLSNSKLSVPEHLRGNIGDCLAIVTQAMLWNMNPFAVAQKTHLVNGKLGYEAQLVNAVLQNSGAVRGLPRYGYRGDGNSLECRVGFIPRGECEVVFGEWLRSGDITTKNSPLWKTNPKQQLGYLQIKNWARAFVPGALLGVYTVDELEDAMMGRDGVTEPSTPAPGPRRKSETVTPPPSPIDAEAGEVPPPSPAPAATRPANPEPSAGFGKSISVGQAAYLRNKLKVAGIGEQVICDRFQVAGIDSMNADQFDELKAELLSMA